MKRKPRGSSLRRLTRERRCPLHSMTPTAPVDTKISPYLNPCSTLTALLAINKHMQRIKDYNAPSRVALRPLPSLVGACPQPLPRDCHQHISQDRDPTIHRDVERLYHGEELPSICQPTAFDLPIDHTDFDDMSLDSDNIEKELFVEWDHDLDPHNPLNWPKWKKALNVSCIFLMCIIS